MGQEKSKYVTYEWNVMKVHVSVIGTHRVFALAKTVSRGAFMCSGRIARLATVVGHLSKEQPSNRLLMTEAPL
jgi:hypothetical protein